MGDNVDKHVKYIPKRLSEYRERDYWDHRYAQEQHAYEWFFPYQHIQHLLDPYLKPFQRILILGCGNSNLSQELVDSSPHQHLEIIDLDYSWPVLLSTRARQNVAINTKYSELICADMRSLPFCNASFDMILDKASLDAIWSHESSSVWNPNEAVLCDVHQIIDEVIRVLKPNGVFLSFSFGQPHFRLPWLKREGQWSINVQPIEGTWYFFYSAQKSAQSILKNE